MVKHPGSSHDAAVLKDSILYKKTNLNKKTILPEVNNMWNKNFNILKMENQINTEILCFSGNSQH